MDERMPATKDQVSPARLNVLRECPRCFWLDMKLGISRPPTPFPTLPARLDRIIQGYCKEYRDSDVLPPLLRRAGVEGRLLSRRVKPWRETTTGLRILGHLDELLETPEGLYAPLDHKTRGYPPTSVNPAYRLQMDIYALLLEGNGLPPAGFGVLVYYVPIDSSPEEGIKLDVQAQVLDTSVERALDYVREAREVLDMAAPPTPSEDCPYCRYREEAEGAQRM